MQPFSGLTLHVTAGTRVRGRVGGRRNHCNCGDTRQFYLRSGLGHVSQLRVSRRVTRVLARMHMPHQRVHVNVPICTGRRTVALSRPRPQMQAVRSNFANLLLGARADPSTGEGGVFSLLRSGQHTWMDVDAVRRG